MPTIHLLSNAPAGKETVQERPNKQGRRDRVIHDVTDPTLTVFLPPQRDPSGIAVVVCPGGGYSGIVIDKEGFQVAQKLNEYRIAAFVLKYRLPTGQPPSPEQDPLPMHDLRRAMQLVRSRATEFRIDPHKIGVMGFSAGGHLAGMIATDSEIDAGSSRPDFAVLAYPVVSMKDPLAHVGSRENLLGKNPGQTLEDRFSVEQRITAHTPPLFIVHAKDDTGVPVKNSMLLAEAATRAGVPCQLLLLEKGGHGFGLGVHGGEASEWMEKCVEWIRKAVGDSTINVRNIIIDK